MAGAKPAGIGFQVLDPIPWHPNRNPNVTPCPAPCLISSLATGLRLVAVYRDFEGCSPGHARSLPVRRYRPSGPVCTDFTRVGTDMQSVGTDSLKRSVPTPEGSPARGRMRGAWSSP